jgi:hypothetical protein
MWHSAMKVGSPCQVTHWDQTLQQLYSSCFNAGLRIVACRSETIRYDVTLTYNISRTMLAER